MNKTLVALAGIAAFLVIAFLGYDLLAPRVNQCEGIFQQTAPSLQTNVKFLETEGGVVLGRTQIQELSARTQEIAVNLKSCCVMAGSGNLDQFNKCKESAVLYGERVAEAVETVKTVTDATSSDHAQKQKEAEERLAAIIQSATEASAALQQQVAEIALKQPGSPEPAPAADNAPQEPGVLRLRAVPTTGGEIVHACFGIHEPKEDLQGNRKQIEYSCSDNAIFNLPAGQYVVFATAGETTARSDLTVHAGQTTDQIIDLNAGHLRTHAELAAGGERVQACFGVYDPEEDLQGNLKQKAYTCTERALLLLPAGDYILDARSGEAAARKEIKITAGGITEQVMVLNAGYLRTHAELTSGGEQVGACFGLFDPKEDLQGNYRQIAYTCGESALLTLPAGDYRLDARAGDAAASVNVTIAAGQATRQPVVLSAGYLRAQAQFAGESQPARACFGVYEPKQDVQGNRRQVSYTCTEKAVFTLPAGSYLLAAQSGDASADLMVEVKAGEIADQLLTLPKP